MVKRFANRAGAFQRQRLLFLVVCIIRVEHVECVAETVEYDHLVADSHSADERIIEYPLHLDYIFANSFTPSNWPQYLYVVQVICFLL